MADSLAKYGLFVDDLCKIRILEPEITTQSDKLKDECHDFVSSKCEFKQVTLERFINKFFNLIEITEFKKNSERFINLLDKLATEVEKEKMRTIGARNLLSSVEKQRDVQKQKIQVYFFKSIVYSQFFKPGFFEILVLIIIANILLIYRYTSTIN